MNGIEERKFKIEQARAWKMKVEHEFNAIDRVLTEVRTECQTIPGEKDPFMNACYEAGETLNMTWKGLKKGFDELVEGTERVAKEIEKEVQNMLDKLNKFVQNIHK